MAVVWGRRTVGSRAPSDGPSARRISNRELLANAEHCWALAALTAAVAGTSLVTMALSVHVVLEAGVGGAGLLAVRFLIPPLAGPFAALPATRMPPGRALLVVSAVRAILLALTVAALAGDAPLTLVIVLCGIDGAAATAGRPAATALLVAIARRPAELIAATTLNTNVKTVATVLGAIAGGYLTASAPATFVFAIGTSLLVLVILALLPLADVGTLPEEPASAREELRRIASGAHTLVHDPRLRTLVLVATTRAMVRSAWVALAVLAATGFLGMGATGVGTLTAAAGAGALASVVGGHMLGASPRLAQALMTSLLVMGAALIGVASSTSPMLAVVGIAVWSFAGGVGDVASASLLPRITSGSELARTVALSETLREASEGVALALVPVTVAVFGARGGIAAIGAATGLVAVMMWSRAAEVDALAQRSVHLIERLRATATFAPLDLAQLSRLAQAVEERPAWPGDVVVREGEPSAGEYYVLDDGYAEVMVGGLPTRTLPPGFGFGETALMYDVAPTWSIAVVTPARLLVLQRDDFLRAISDGNARHSRHGADEVDAATALGTSPLLARLDGPAVARLAAEATERVVRDGEVLWYAGDVPRCLIGVLSGAVDVRRPGEVRPFRLGPGATIGDIALMENAPHGATVMAHGTVRLAEVSSDAIAQCFAWVGAA
jgi:CRP-like cAMP-binding protein/MFS family permease